MKKSIFLLSLLFIITAQSDVLSYSNKNLCARQSVEPATSVYLLLDGFAPGRAALKRALDLKTEKSPFLKTAWAEFHKRGYFLSQKIIRNILAGKLPTIPDSLLGQCTSQVDKCPQVKQFVLEKWLLLDNANELTPGYQCTWIKKTIPNQFSTKIPNRSDLEQIALAYLDKNNYIARCENILSLVTQEQPDLMLKLSVPEFKSSEEGFRFWSQFKIYLSLIWGQKIKSKDFHFEDLSRSFSADELFTIMADGCKSISKPECSTDFLNTSQFREIIKKGKFDNNYLMANEILKSEIKQAKNNFSEEGVQSLNDPSFDVRKQLLGTMKFRHQANYQLYLNLKKLKTIFNQKTEETLITDITSANFSDAEKETLCAENNKFINQEISGFAKEIRGASQIFAIYQDKDIVNLWEKSISLNLKLQNFCKEVDRNLKNKMLDPESLAPADKTKKWFNTVTQYSLPFNIQYESTQDLNFTSAQAYVKLGSDVICSDALRCGRNIIESAVALYQVLLFRKQVLSSEANEMNADKNLSATVACHIYDPWAPAQIRKKKLISDLISSVISGVTLLPIYLDLNFERPQVVSFKQLIENGNVKFDPVFNEDDVKKTLFLDLGPFAKAPCYLSLSNSQDLKLHQNRYVFSGITFQGCMKSAEGEMASDLLNLTDNKLKELSACGSCTLNFEEAALAAVHTQYSVFRAGLRFFASLIYFLKDLDNPNSNPIEFQVDTSYVTETFKKYNSIPDKCVFELINGSQCMENLCVSKTVSEYERLSGNKVESASIWNSNGELNSFQTLSKDVWIKIKGCDGEFRIPITCEDNKKPSFIGLTSYLTKKKCSKEP